MTTFLVFYKLKTMSKDEAQKAKAEWKEIKKNLPMGIHIAGEYDSAWGTPYNGFLLFESETTDAFLEWWPTFKDNIRWYITETHTIIARKRR